MSVYKMSLSTISPLFIGEGKELRQGFDFVMSNGRTYRFNEEKVLEARQSKLVPDRSGQYPLPGRLLDKQDLQDTALIRYVLPGEIHSNRADARLQSCIKDVYDRPYIPGSSIKGALRTALGWYGWKEKNLKVDFRKLGRRDKFAASAYEKDLFGDDPRKDLLKALRVGDCYGPEKAGQGLQIVNAQVLTKRSAGSPIELEAIKPDQCFTGSLSIDDSLFSAAANELLGLNDRKHWLDDLTRILNDHSRARIRMLAEQFQEFSRCDTVTKFYQLLLGQGELSQGNALIQLGWGTGWDGKTFWSRLQDDEDDFEEIINRYRMHRATRNSPRRKPGDDFPRSRRLVMSRKTGEPVRPFGWVLFQLEKIR